MPHPRNPFALHPLMRKGGAHTRSATAARAQAQRSCEDEAADYLAERNAARCGICVEGDGLSRETGVETD